jgi:CDP-diacylglycerol--glycerol-3-phosphate 3-phosphatidyltransferase
MAIDMNHGFGDLCLHWLSLRWSLMLSARLKPTVTRVITPVAAFALRRGITPNAVTWVGAIGVVVCALYFYPRGDFFIGTVAICILALSDLFDGTMARLSSAGSSKWGEFLDSTIDRITDSSILLGVSIYLIKRDDLLDYVVLVTLVAGLLVPYIRAKAESFGIPCSGGIAERTERLIISLAAIGFDGLGVPYVLAGGMWILALLGMFTVLQRMLIVKRAT